MRKAGFFDGDVFSEFDVISGSGIADVLVYLSSSQRAARSVSQRLACVLFLRLVIAERREKGLTISSVSSL
jgi:hypothetical protein